ncbi:hypothetical protein [Spirosoma litoris]
MIAITNDSGESLQLDPQQNLVTEQNVAWLSDDELPGEFSYPIEAPLNEANKRFVGQGYRPDAAQPRAEIPVSVHLDGVLYRRCTFNYRVNEGKLSGFLKIDSSEFYDSIRKLTLLEALPTPVAVGDGLVGTPPVSLSTRLVQIAQLTPGEFPFTFFPIRNQAMIEDAFDETKLAGFVRNDYLNAWEPLTTGGYGFPIDLPNKPAFGYLLCPQFYLAYVLEQIMALAGYKIESDWLYSEEGRRITVLNLTAMNQTISELGGFISGHLLVPGMFLPDTTVSDFLKAVKGRFGLVFGYNANSKTCYIVQFTRTVAKGSAIDLTPFQSGPYSSFDKDGKGYKVIEYVDGADGLYKDLSGNTLTPASQITGLGTTEITLKAGTTQLAYEKSPLSTTNSWFVPTVLQPGNILDPKYNQSERYLTKEGKRPNSVGIRFLSYRGMSVDSSGRPYPLATPDVRGGAQTVIGSEALTLTGRYGAWRKYLRAYFYFRDQTQRITQKLLMPVATLASLQLHRLVSLSLDDQVRRSYAISKLQAEAPGLDGKVLVKLEVLTLPSGIEINPDVDDPLVWVELTVVRSGLISSGGFNPILTKTASLSVTCWQDQAKTTPALVTNLPVVIRQKKTWTNATSPYQETPVTYLANGAQTVLESALLVYESTPGGPAVGTATPTEFTLVVSLDPSDGYLIL